MAMYSVVADGYDVDVYRSRKSVCEALTKEPLYFSDDDDGDTSEPVTARQLAKALSKSRVVRLSEEAGSNDWKYRIELQDRIY